MLFKFSKRQKYAYSTALLSGTAILLFLIHPDNKTLHARGPMNTGHEKLKCIACHKPVKGSLRQRLQHNARYLIGKVKKPVSLGHSTVGNSECQQCHARPNDRHPIYRFSEPKFIKLRKTLAPHECNSCHKEHSALRVTNKIDYCMHCHEELVINKDPIDIPHQALVKKENWDSCLGCHDYHGNHVRQAQNKLDQAFSKEIVINYFNKGESPYSDKKQYKTKRITKYEY